MTRKWRPSYKCVYVISDILGNANSLDVILERLFPLRFHEGQQDTCVFLGDYTGVIEDGCDVIDMFINIKHEYNDRVICIRGNQEERMLRAILGGVDDFNHWCDNGGRPTIAGYLRKNNSSANPYAITQNRLSDLIPKSHVEFLQATEHYYILNEDYCFMHSGIDPKKPVRENSFDNFIFDTTSNRYVKTSVRNKTPIEFVDPYVYVCSENPQGKSPYIHPRYMMLGGTSPEKIIVLEMNSMCMSACTSGKSRIYKYDYDVME